MKHLTTAIVATALLAFTIPAWAQVYPAPQMPYYSAYPAPQMPYYSAYPAPQMPYYSSYWPEMVDNGCCTDFPTHTPSDFVADQLNRQVVNFNNASPMYMPRY